MTIILIIALGLAFWGLILGTKVGSAAFFARKSVLAHGHSQLEEIVYSASLFKRLVHGLAGSGYAKILFEFVIQGWQFGEGFVEAFACSFHAALVPNNFAQFAVEPIWRTCAFGVEVSAVASLCFILGFFERWVIDAWDCFSKQRCQLIADGVRQHEVAVGQTLHQCRSTQTVCTVVGEVGFTGCVQARNGRHQFVVHPQTAHGVVRCWVNTHRRLVRVFAGNALVHFKQVAVALFNDVKTETLDGCGEVEVDAVF